MKKFANIVLAGFISLNLFSQGQNVRTENQLQATGSPDPKQELRVRQAVKSQIKNFLNARGNILRAEVTAKETSFLTVESEGVSIKVNITDKTQFRRLFWGKSSLDEIKVGDRLNIIGRWANEEKTEINAVVIRDLSVIKRRGVFFGEVKNLNGTGFVMTTVHNQDQTVTIGTAKLVNREEETITQADIQVGHRVRIKGLWDATAKTISEVTQVKDFSLPL